MRKKEKMMLWICRYCKEIFDELPGGNCPYCFNSVIIPLRLFNKLKLIKSEV